MKISHLGLSAFHATAQTLNMTEAAKNLGVTQSALSQRLMQLESELEVTLFIRDPKGLILTDEGQRLLRYAETHFSLEEEVLGELMGSRELGGSVRIAGFSSIMRSMIIPKLTPFLRQFPKINCSFQTHEVIDLPQVLSHGQADFIILDYELNRKGVGQVILDVEEYVVIESVKYKSPADIYLDHGPLDNATESFFSAHGKHQPYRRAFMGDVYGIIQGVEEGMGRGVMSKHLIENNKKVSIVKGFKPYKRPVTLHYYERPFYPKVLSKTLEELTKKA